MKALVPFNREESYEAYKQAGAGEFYLGFYDPDWHRVFGEYADLNRLTGYKDWANCNTFEEVLSIIRKVKKEKLAIYVTFNSSTYSQKQLEYMEKYMEPLYEAGVDGVIVSCPELVELAKKHQLSVVISTIAGVYNSDIATYYQKLGVDRIILPRDLSLEDIERIVNKVSEVEYEVFLMRNGCSFSDSNCLGQHRTEKSAICATLRESCNQISSYADGDDIHGAIEQNHRCYQQEFHVAACGLCSIYRFVTMGIAAGKIVGRTEQYEDICKDIRLICENVTIAKSCTSEREFLEKMIVPNDHVTICKTGLNCYYPEVRF